MPQQESDGMLGVLRVLVTVPAMMLGTLADLLARLVGPEGRQWFEALKKFLRKEEAWLAVATDFVQDFYETVVDCTKTLAEMIVDGKYDWVNPDITQEHFPVSDNGKEKREQALFWFRRDISSDDAIAGMRRAGYEPEDIAGLLAFGRDNQELQRRFPIIALKSVWVVPVGGHRVPCLFGLGAGRYLSLRCLEDDWFGHCRFLARKCQK